MAEFTSPEHLNLSGIPSGPGRMGTRPISARSRCLCGMRAPWRPVTRRGLSCCKSRSGPCPDKRFCLGQKPWRTPSRSEAFRSATARRAALSAEMAEFTSPEHLNLSGTPSGPGRVGTRPISARSRCLCGTRAPWRPATRRALSCCNSNEKETRPGWAEAQTGTCFCISFKGAVPIAHRSGPAPTAPPGRTRHETRTRRSPDGSRPRPPGPAPPPADPAGSTSCPSRRGG